MKIWLKYLIATLIGIVAGLVIPAGDGAALEALARVLLNIGRYALLPLTFFSAAIAAFELHEDRRLHRALFKTALAAAASVAIFGLVGLAGAFVLAPGRIPLSTDATQPIGAPPTLIGIAEAVLAADASSTLVNFGFILPAAVFAMILGLAFSFDKSATKPVVALFDSMSRILWQINSFFVEILPLPLIVASAARAVAIARTPRLAVFGSLFGAVAVETAIAVLVILPLALWLADRKTNPYQTIFALSAPALAALVSGHGYVQAGAAAKHLKESLGVRRRAGAVGLPTALAFGRAGTAMVTATAFVTVLNSYSNLGLGSSTFIWMLASVPACALLLGAAPGSGPIVAISALCAAYGRGFESGYILLVPVALPLAMAAAFMDSLVSSCIVNAVSRSEGHAHAKELRHFI